jgi:muramoyltetrapeptide carboxypeptidase
MLRTAVGIVAPSSVVPPVEFTLGVEQLKEAGFSVYVHPQCGRRHLFFAGTDEERARAFYDFAVDSSLSVLWCARGGHGAVRILPYLDRIAAERGVPEPKLLVGYSDATALLEYVRTRWGWHGLHAPMPGLREFSTLERREWKAITRLVKGRDVASPWGKRRLRFFGKRPARAIRAQLVGGNLSVWASLMGTPFAPRARDKILFFEDVSEALYRVDRMVQQLAGAGAFEKAKAIVLGEFESCLDSVPKVLMAVPAPRARGRILRQPAPQDLGALRPRIAQRRGLREIFGEIGERWRLPVAYGLPVGHGPGHSPLPIGAQYRLTPDGTFELADWGWLNGRA